jgi:acetyl esterase/lipase
MSLSDSSTWPQYAAIDREFEAALKLAPPLPSIGDMPSVAAARDMFSQAMVQFASLSPQPDYTGVKKSTIQIPVRDGTSIPAVLYQPETASNDGPLVVLYHGGGFCLGAPEMEEPIALECVRRYGAVALSVDYRMAPEHPFPVAIEDSFDALEWVCFFLLSHLEIAD